MLLGLNIDHVATLREARYRDRRDSPLAEPNILQAAHAVIAAGADSITIHTRADQRHMQQDDALALKQELPATPLNLEMGITQPMLEFALQLQPHYVCLVPEGRDEVTTEGGLDILSQIEKVRQTTQELQDNGSRVSLFIDPELDQVRAAANSKAAMIELHTGAYANALRPEQQQLEIQRLIHAAELGHQLGLQVNAGHGIRLDNIAQLAQIPHLSELNIGHSTIARALFIGLQPAVRELRNVIDQHFPPNENTC